MSDRGTIIMRVVSNLLFFGLMSLSLASCSTVPSTSTFHSTFSAENIMKIHKGMSSDEVLALFGEPKSISVNICGRAPNQWTCTTWEYGDGERACFICRSKCASFTFSGEHDSLKLNNFEVHRE